MNANEQKQIDYCLKLYDDFKKKNNANDLFKVFYEVEARLRSLKNGLNN